MLIENFPKSCPLSILIASETAQKKKINNQPPEFLLNNLFILACGLTKVTELLKQTLTITSAYRCPELNKVVGGVENSQHIEGLAADFICPTFGLPLDIAKTIAVSNIEFDQLIHELGRWVHISFAKEGVQARREILTLCPGGGYQEGLHHCKK